jgi:hypothetical protein
MTDLESLAFDGRGNLVDLSGFAEPGPPADLTWSRLELLPQAADSVLGMMVSLSDHSGFDMNLVVVSEMFTDAQGTWVRVAPYATFFRWSQMPAETRPAVVAPARAVLVKYLWVMHDVTPGSADEPGSGAARGSAPATGPFASS